MTRELIAMIPGDLPEDEFVARAVAAITGRVGKHHPGGKDHDQSSHGRRGGSPGGGGKEEGKGSEKPAPQAADRTPPSPSETPGPRIQAPSNPAAQTPGEDPSLVNRTIRQATAIAGPRLDHIADVAGTSQMSIEGTRRGLDTMGMYGQWKGNEFVGYTPERMEWQVNLLRDMEAQQIRENDNHQPKAEKQAIIMAGLPGSGKTYLLNNTLAEKFDLRDYVTVNADDIKSRIISDDTPPKISDLVGEELSSMVHEESSVMAKQWQVTLEERGMNIALDITAADEAKTVKRIQNLMSKGYTVHLVHSDIPVDESIASTMKRAVETSPAPGKVGRPVPPDFIEAMDAGGGVDVIDNAFQKYQQIANGDAYWYRNYPLSRKPPVLVSSKVGNTAGTTP